MKRLVKNIILYASGVLGEVVIVCGFVIGLTAIIAGIVLILP